jgi:hypothetical protein
LQQAKSNKGPPTAKKQSVTPVVGGWVTDRKKDQGQICFFDIFWMVFLAPYRETIKKNSRKMGFVFFWDKNGFRHEFLQNVFL